MKFKLLLLFFSFMPTLVIAQEASKIEPLPTSDLLHKHPPLRLGSDRISKRPPSRPTSDRINKHPPLRPTSDRISKPNK